MNKKIGRNDPCPCGSGKKYKKCHLGMAFEEGNPIPQTPRGVASPAFLGGTKRVGLALRQLTRSGPKKDRAQFGQMMSQTEPIMEYLERQEQIEAASTVLEASRERFMELANNKDAYLAQAKPLFAEERFAPFWFTEEEVQSACAKAGLVTPVSMEQTPDDPILTALLQLADSDRRRKLTLGLLRLLPDYVAAGRLMDGWIIQSSAFETIELDTQSNPFLFFMFAHGYDAWVDAELARDAEVLRTAGLDVERLRRMDMREIEAWVKTQGGDPVLNAKVEAIMASHPGFRARAIGDLQAMEGDAETLIERPDAREIRLKFADIAPLTGFVSQRWATWRKQHPKVDITGQPTELEAESFSKMISQVTREMAESIITPERLQDLLARLKEYRDERLAAGDQAAARAALGAIVPLERQRNPADNQFLNLLCFQALREFPPGTIGKTSAEEQ